MKDNEMDKELNFVLIKINNLLKERHMNRYQLSLKSEIDPNVVNRWYVKNSMPDFNNIVKIATLGFGLSLSAFFAETNDLREISKDEEEILKAFQALSKTQQKKLLDFIHTL